jgi:ketosteroid isomerase-like protein
MNKIQSVFTISLILTGCTLKQEQTDSEKNVTSIIQKNLIQFATYAKEKDADSMLSMFDNSDDIMLVGSDSSEVKHGRKEIRNLLHAALSKPYIINWDFTNAEVFTSSEVAWAFVNSSVMLLNEDGSEIRIPYRLTSVWIKQGENWKLKFFNGSIPGKG